MNHFGTNFENDLLVGQDSYPTSIGGATHLLTNWKVNNTPNRQQPPPNNRDNRTGGGRNVTFVQVPLPANDDFLALPGYDPDRPTCAPSRKHPHNITAHITCVHCNKLGHYATACPFLIAGRPQFFQLARPATQLNQSQTMSFLIPGSIIVDSGSTFNCFREHNLICDLQTCDPFETYSNGGGMTYTEQGVISLLPELDCYYNPDCLVNIVSLDLLQAKYHTTFDSEQQNTFIVEISDTTTITFEGCSSGLYSLT
jgi:hypothetical protein